MKTERHGTQAADVVGPDFIGVGAARCGTTWLASSLSQCEGVWLPRRKELHYFSRSRSYLSPSYLEAPRVYSRLFGLNKNSSRFRVELMKALGGDILRRSWAQLRWDLKYFLGRNDRPSWYDSLFQQGEGITTGEITPAYGLLNDADVTAISQRYPRLKVIYIIRNPVDRAWSTICYHQKRTGKPLTQYARETVIDYLTHPSIAQRSDYLSVVQRWRTLHGTDKFFLAYYDDLINRPTELLHELLEFLDIQATNASPVTQRVNASTTIPIPPDIAATMATCYLPAVEQLADAVGGPPLTWVDELNAQISGGRRLDEPTTSD